MEGVRCIIAGTRKRALIQVLMDELRFSRLFTDGTRNSSKLLWLCTDDTSSKANVGSLSFCSCPVISRFVDDMTLAVDSKRGAVWWFGRGLAHSFRGMVLTRAVRGVLASSSLHKDEPVRTTRGPTPLRRCIGAMVWIRFDFLLIGALSCEMGSEFQFPCDSVGLEATTHDSTCGKGRTIKKVQDGKDGKGLELFLSSQCVFGAYISKQGPLFGPYISDHKWRNRLSDCEDKTSPGGSERVSVSRH